MKPDCLSKLEVVIRLLYFGVYLRYDVIENHKSTIFNSSICYLLRMEVNTSDCILLYFTRLHFLHSSIKLYSEL